MTAENRAPGAGAGHVEPEPLLATWATQSDYERLRLAIDIATDGLWDWDVPNGNVYNSPQCFLLCGYPAPVDTNDPTFFTRMIHPDDLADAMASIVAHRDGYCDTEDFECRLVGEGGRIIWVHVFGRTVAWDADGKPTRIIGIISDITEKRRAREALRLREQQLERVLEGSEQGYWEWDMISGEVQLSARWETMLGYAPGEVGHSFAEIAPLIHPDDLEPGLASVQRHVDGITPMHVAEVRYRCKDGSWRWVLSRAKMVERDASGAARLLSGTNTDITERKQLELTQAEAVTVFESSLEGIMVVSLERRIVRVNPAFTRITGYHPDEVVQQPLTLLASGHHDDAFYDAVWETVRQSGSWRGEVWERRKNGEVYPQTLSISTVCDGAGTPQHCIAVFSDISHFKAHEAELDRIAHFDPLTGAPNRRLLTERLAQAIKAADRNATTMAICFLDLDGFKDINDQHGHAAGDQLLVAVADNLALALRAADTMARLGGDEFVLLLLDVGGREQCVQVLERILQAVRTPVLLGETEIQVSASIGVTLYPDDQSDAETLLRNADQAMYAAKHRGKNRYCLFDAETDRRSQQQRRELDAIAHGLQHGQFELYYQPKVDLRDGSIIGAEALLRWRHPQRGLLLPGVFLPFIDGSSLEVLVGEWVIRTGLAQAAAWRDAGMPVAVSVNIGADHLLQPDFCIQLQQAMRCYADAATLAFEVEVLETVALGDMQRALTVLRNCQSFGVRFALDDFGTGYSSLTYLRKLPFDMLKIDRSFVQDMLEDSEDLSIVEGVIQLAAAFNRAVIAEGVESLTHGAALLALGCPLVQGYGIGRPMPAADFGPWAARWQRERAWEALAR